MVLILVFANWAKPDTNIGLWFTIYSLKWVLTSLGAIALATMLIFCFKINLGKVLLIAGVTAVLAWRFPAYPLIPMVDYYHQRRTVRLV